MADQKWYDQGLRPRILINWQSFEDWGIPSSWKAPFTDAVINAYTRWMNQGGVDLRFQFWGYTNKITSDIGELMIKMNEKHANSSRLASTFGAYNKLEIVFHRKRGSDLTPWNFVPYNANPGEFDMQGILMHELGHCLGLDHSSSIINTMYGSYVYLSYRFGPFDDDVNRVRSVYSDFVNNRLRQVRSVNSGESWSIVGNDLTRMGSNAGRTNVNLGVTATPRSGFYLVGWTLVGSRHPTWLRGDGEKFLTRHWLFYGGEHSIYGPVYAHDSDRTMMWVWVKNDNVGTIKIVVSTNQGYQWYWVNSPPSSRTFGTPGLCCTRVNGQSTWILVWSHFDRNDHNGTGYIRSSISTNNGSTWSTPVILNTFYKVLSGVSATAGPNNQVVVAFSWAPNTTYGINLIRSFDCQVSNGQLQQTGTSYTRETTRIQPAVTYESQANRFIIGWRGQDFYTLLNSMYKLRNDASWSGKVILPNSSHVAPALSSSNEYRESVMWYAYEGD